MSSIGQTEWTRSTMNDRIYFVNTDLVIFISLYISQHILIISTNEFMNALITDLDWMDVQFKVHSYQYKWFSVFQLGVVVHQINEVLFISQSKEQKEDMGVMVVDIHYLLEVFWFTNVMDPKLKDVLVIIINHFMFHYDI